MTDNEGNQDDRALHVQHRDIGGCGLGCRDRHGRAGHWLVDQNLMADETGKVMMGMDCH